MMFFTKEQTANLVNVLPGIATPLRFQQETVGVLGLIGDPMKVERYVQFVQSHIEMILMENHRSRTVAAQMETMQDFFNRLLLYKETADYSNMHRICKLHGFTLGIPRRVILFNLQTSEDRRLSNEETHTFNNEEQELYGCLRNLFIQNELDRVVPLTTGEWLILITDHMQNTTSITTKLECASDKLRSFLKTRKLGTEFIFSFSNHSPTIERLIDDYEHCSNAMMIARRHHLKQPIIPVSDWNLLTYQLEEITLPAQKTLDNHIEKILNHVNGAILIESFLVYCEMQLNMSKAARDLYIHRNTLLYRLQQLQEISGIDLDCFKQCTLLYLALKKHKYE